MEQLENGDNKVKVIKKTYLCVIGAFVIAAILFKVVFNAYTPLGWVCFGLAALIAVYYLIGLMAVRFARTAKIISKILTYALFLFIMFFAITAGSIFRTGAEPVIVEETDQNTAEETDKADYLIILGAGIDGTEPSRILQERLERGAEYLHQYPEVVCVVSGSKGNDEEISEAECMRLWLEEAEVPPERIIKEEKAENTVQNILLSYDMIQQDSKDENVKIAIATSDFHVLRTQIITEQYGIDSVFVTAKTSNGLMRINQTIREVFAIWNQVVFGRLG